MSATLSLPAVWERRFDHVAPADTYEQRAGRCYELAANAQFVFAWEGWSTSLVHGQVGPHGNPHAWLEWGAVVWDGTLDRVFPRRVYRDEMHARRWSIYSAKVAQRMVVRYEHWGVWGAANVARYEARVAAMEAAGVGRHAWEVSA